MPFSLTITDLPRPRFNEVMLRVPLQALREIKARCEARFGRSEGSPKFQNRKAILRERLIRCTSTGESFAQATDVVGRERLLLSIYLDELGKSGERLWLPPFDQQMAYQLLGGPGANLSSARRRQATNFFFIHFDKIDGLPILCQRLQEAYQSADSFSVDKISVWAAIRSLLFTTDGPVKIASNARRDESIDELRQRNALPSEGRFVEALRHVFLLESLTKCAFGSEPSTLDQIEQTRGESAPGSMRLGAAALQILVRRIVNEGGRWPEGWQKWILRLGCDPRFGRASAEGTKWWSWATEAELRLAQQGVTGLTLRFFIEFLQRSLKGTDKEPQFEMRSRFLLGLFDANKIIDARLALNWSSLQRLDARYRDPWSIAQLSATNDDTSMIALRCTDDVFVIEGTHSFGLRSFHRAFPVAGFWERSKKVYQDKDIRVSPSRCPIFVRHAAGGNWVETFINELRRQFHVEWGDVRLGATRSSSTPRNVDPPSKVVPMRETATPHMPPFPVQPMPIQSAIAKPAAIIEDYIRQLTRFLFLSAVDRTEAITSRATLFRILLERGKIKAARLIKEADDRPSIVLVCSQGITLVDAAHYLNLRGTCDDAKLWDNIEAASHNPGRCSSLMRDTDYELRVSHMPPTGYAKRFRDQLTEKCGVTWDDVVF
jgi:hypothetical protein